jgi:hypothetical protein
MLTVCACLVLACSLLSAQAPSSTTPAQQTEPQVQPAAAQDRTPVEQLQVYVDGFHNYQRDAKLPAEKQMQMRVAHYCQPLNPDFIQCIVYDGNTKNARMIGIEHIISDAEYKKLAPGEQKYWHPHDGEVDSGMLDLPGMAEDKKKDLLQMIRTTHGKTWHVWDAHAGKIPAGKPTLMWAIDPQKMNAKTKSGVEERKKNPTF